MVSPFIALGIAGVVAFSLVFGIGFCCQRYDRIVVSLMRRFNICVYPTAISIAMLLIEHPEQWSADQHRMSHPDIGSIWTANDAYGLKIETAFGTWKPNAIERRIIRDAVDWRIGDYIRNRLLLAAQRNALR